MTTGTCEKVLTKIDVIIRKLDELEKKYTSMDPIEDLKKKYPSLFKKD